MRKQNQAAAASLTDQVNAKFRRVEKSWLFLAASSKLSWHGIRMLGLTR